MTTTAKALRATAITGLVLLMLLAGFLVLVIAGLETGPAAFGLAIVLAVLPVPVYLALVLWIDRYEPEPLQMIVITFVWGATIAAFVAIIVNSVGEVIVSQELGTEAAELYGYSISAPIVEEAIKGLILFGLFWFYRREFNGIIDGIVYASLVGLGFAMTENILYYGRGAAEEGVVGAVMTFVVRGIVSPFAHPLFTAMTGIGLGIAATSGNKAVRVIAPLVGLALAMILHSIWNTSAGAGLFLGAYLLIMLPVFLALIGVIVYALRREGRVIAEQLGPLLPASEVTALASLRERRRWRQEAARRGGSAAKRTMTDYQRTAAELAFQRYQVAQGAIPDDRLTRARDSALLARLGTRRRELAGPAG